MNDTATLEIPKYRQRDESLKTEIVSWFTSPIIERHHEEVAVPAFQLQLKRERESILDQTEKKVKEVEVLLHKLVADESDRSMQQQLGNGLVRRKENFLQEISDEADKLLAAELKNGLSDYGQELFRELFHKIVSQEKSGGMIIEIFNPEKNTSTFIKRQHYMFPVLLKLLCIENINNQPLNVALYGPAGNGKTSMALNCAEALGIASVLQPFNPNTTKSDLLGYMAANGQYVPSAFYEAFTKGKIFIADEFDACNPAIAITLNAAVANRTLTFPNNETIKAHPNFRALFIMNTQGTGADHQYTGRMRQDAAALDRMVYLNVPIDKGLEAAMAGISMQSSVVDIAAGGLFKDNKEILSMVQSVRQAVEELKMKYIISPRAVLNSTAMHAGGFGKDLIMECCIWKGMPEADRQLIKSKANI